MFKARFKRYVFFLLMTTECLRFVRLQEACQELWFKNGGFDFNHLSDFFP